MTTSQLNIKQPDINTYALCLEDKEIPFSLRARVIRNFRRNQEPRGPKQPRFFKKHKFKVKGPRFPKPKVKTFNPNLPYGPFKPEPKTIKPSRGISLVLFNGYWFHWRKVKRYIRRMGNDVSRSSRSSTPQP